MRWVIHLLVAGLAAMLAMVVWEQFSGVSISQEIMSMFARFDIGPGLAIGILAIAALALWAKSSSG